MTRLMCVLFALAVGGQALTGQGLTLAIFDPEAFMGGNGTVFRGRFEGGRFTTDTVLARLTASYRPGATVTAMAADGRSVRLRVKRINKLEGDLYEGLLEFAPLGPVPPHAPGEFDPLLVFPAGAPVHVLRTERAKLELRVERELRFEADRRFRRAVTEGKPEGGTGRLRLRAPEIRQVEGKPDFIFVRFPAEVWWTGAEQPDTRASVFFIYSVRERKSILATFGHPEWAPVDEDLVLTVRPFIFFTVGSEGRVFFLGERALGWESNGFAVFDVQSGKTVLESY